MKTTDIAVSLTRETTVDLTAPDGRKIYLRRTAAGDGVSRRAVILAHGLAGSPSGYMHMTARDYFTAHGYDVYRLAFYWDAKGYRKLHDCTLQLHAADLNEVVEVVKDQHAQVFICGHSYGGLTCVFANPDVTALSLWDPSYQPWEGFLKDSTTPAADGETYLLDWECQITLGQKMIEEARTLTRERARALAVLIKIPTQVVVAEQGGMPDEGRMLYADLATEKDLQSVAEATHTFVEGRIIQELFDHAHVWFGRHS